MTTGFIMTMVGALGAVGGAVWMGDAAAQTPDGAGFSGAASAREPRSPSTAHACERAR
jgi:hypothetical protein